MPCLEVLFISCCFWFCCCLPSAFHALLEAIAPTLCMGSSSGPSFAQGFHWHSLFRLGFTCAPVRRSYILKVIHFSGCMNYYTAYHSQALQC